MRAAVRIDLDMLHTDELFSNDPQALEVFTSYLGQCIEDAIYEFAKLRLGQDVMMAVLRQSVYRWQFSGLGPAWHPEKENSTFIPGSLSAPTWNEEFTLDPVAQYDDGCRHIALVVDWS